MAFGTLERRKGAAPMSDINMTPLIDVMLVLLVIFMLAAPLLVSAIKVDLPRQGGSAISQQAPHVDLTLDAQGVAFVAGQPMPLGVLETLFAHSSASNAATELRLSADVQVPHGRVVEVMALAHRNGITRVRFVTREGLLPKSPKP